MPTTTEKDFDDLESALIENNIGDLKKVLRSFDVTATSDLTGANCLMVGCIHSSSPEFMKLIFNKIDEAGGPAILRTQLAATARNGMTCLMAGCIHSSSPEFMKLLFAKISEAGGRAMLKSQLTASNHQITAIDRNGWTCLTLSCTFCSSPLVMKLLAVVMFELDVFKQQYAELDDFHKNKLKEVANIDSASWTPDPASLAEVKAILKNEEPANKIQSQQQQQGQQKLDASSGQQQQEKKSFENPNSGKPFVWGSGFYNLPQPKHDAPGYEQDAKGGDADSNKSINRLADDVQKPPQPSWTDNPFANNNNTSGSSTASSNTTNPFASNNKTEEDSNNKNKTSSTESANPFANKNSSFTFTFAAPPSSMPSSSSSSSTTNNNGNVLRGSGFYNYHHPKGAEQDADSSINVPSGGGSRGCSNFDTSATAAQERAKKKAEEEAALAKKKAEEEAAAKRKAESQSLPRLSLPCIQKSTLNLDLNTFTIGSGATCSVYSCNYFHTECAAKIFHSHITSDKAVQREMKAAVHLKHPNIVNVLALIVDDTDKSKIIGILMQRMHGTLLQRVTNIAPFDMAPPPTLLELVKWCSQTASAILCAHSLNCIHCDIKPENVMLDSHGNAHLTDFGSAHVITTAATKVTSVRGTALFIAPEYAALDVTEPNEKTDVFSFGMLMWVVLHFNKDHGMGKSEVQIGRSLDRGKRPEISNRDLPAEIVSLIEKCWHEDADERPAMADVLTVFNQVIAKIEESEKAASSVFKLTPSPLWTDARFLKSKYGTIADHLTSLKWNTRADAPSLHFSEDIIDKNSPLVKFIEAKFRPSPGFKKEEQIYSDTHFSGKFSRLQMVQPADAHHLFLALHEADGSSRTANAFLRHKNNSDSASQNALEKLKSVFEDPEVNPETNNANFSRILFGWHGTNASIAEKVCRDGPRSLRLTDAGFFGAGSYFSLEADYAANYAYMSNTNSKGEYAIILFAVSVSQTYPITLQHDYRSKEDSHRPEMHGFGNFYNGPDPKKAIALAPKCDSHFIPVKKHGDGKQHPLGKYDIMNGNAVVEKNKTSVAMNLDQQACDAKDPEVFGHEIVILNHQRAIPVAILYFK